MVPRERFARVWVTALWVATLFYVVALLATTQFRIELTLLMRFALLGAALGGLGVVALVTHVVVRDRTGAGVDERDHLIEARASAVGYYLLMTAMIVVGCFMPFSASPWEIVHAAVASMVLSEIVHTTLVVRGYERGIA